MPERTTLFNAPYPILIMNNQRHFIAEQLRQLTRLYIQTQKFRIRNSNLWTRRRIDLAMARYDTESNDARQKEMIDSIRTREENITKEIKNLVKLHPWNKWLSGVKGCGPYISGTLIGELDGFVYKPFEKGEKSDKIESEEYQTMSPSEYQKTLKSKFSGYGRSFDKTSNLWHYCGYHVVDGKAAKPKKGQLSDWNKYLKQALYQFAETQVKLSGPYRKLYDNRKVYEVKRNKEISKMHAHKRAMRYIIKKFLSDFRYEGITSKVSM